MEAKKLRIDNEMLNLVKSVRTSSLNLTGVSEEFKKYHKKIDICISTKLALGSREQYLSAFSRFEKFCVDNNLIALPSHPEVIMTYFIKISEEKNSLSTVLMARAAINHVNKLFRADLPSPTDHPDVVSCVKSIEKRFSKPVKKSAPMSKQILDTMIDKVLQGDQLRDKNFLISIDKWQIVAKTVLKFNCMARFEEAVDLKKSSFEFLDNGDCKILFLKGKTNQTHDANENIIASIKDSPYCPVNILFKYFLRFGVKEDHLFMPQVKNGLVYLDEPASYRYCLDQLRLTLKDLGVPNWKDFGEHSDRCGGISAAANAGVSESVIQIHARMKSDKTPRLYIKRSMQQKRNISHLLNSL